MLMVRVAVVGAGQFGQNHVRVVRGSERAELSAAVDADFTKAEATGAPALADFRALPGRCDAAIIAAPTSAHTEIGCFLMEAGIDVLVEKPIATNLAEADRLVETAARTGRILQVGHLERFNPVVQALEQAVTAPLFFEIHRMSVFSPRSLDVDVVLDLMIHDLDIVLALQRDLPEEIRAAGVSILSPNVDIANVRLQFPNGCVANLTASRVSTEKIRKLRLFQPREYISLDYSKQHAVRFRVGDDRQIQFSELSSAKAEPLQAQFDAFLDSVTNRTPPKVDGVAARRTLSVALAILDKMKAHADVVADTLSGSRP
jgi:predicted dehydrogenase